MVVAPGRMIDSFLSIPDAESLPLYRMVLKLACVCVCVILVYTKYMTGICFLEKSIFVYYGMHVCMQ